MNGFLNNKLQYHKNIKTSYQNDPKYIPTSFKHLSKIIQQSSTHNAKLRLNSY